jgi:hypothetical protein
MQQLNSTGEEIPMSSREVYLYDVECEREDGSRTRVPVYQKGRTYYIQLGLRRVIAHPSARQHGIEHEIRILTEGKLHPVRTLMRGES